MPRYRFTDPETTTIQLSEGDWIEVKKFLNAGEDKEYKGAGVTRMSPDGQGKSAFDLDFKRLGLAKMRAYLVAWSFCDKKGRQTKPTAEWIASLDVETADEIDKALDAHIEAMETEKNAQKSVAPSETN